MLKRIKTKPGYKYLAFLILFFCLFHFINSENKSYIQKLHNSTITCNIKGKGWTVIDSSKITGFDDETGTLIFKNGFARNCIIEDN